MIETERQHQAALSWIRYWQASLTAGDQSWFGDDEARGEIMTLRRQIVEYEKRKKRL